MPRPRRRTFGQKVKRAAIIAGIAGAAAFGTAMAVSPNFRANVANTVEEAASQVAKRGVGAAAGAGAAYVYAKGKRGWRKGRATGETARKAAMIGAGVGGALLYPPYGGAVALGAAAAGPENLKKAGRFAAEAGKKGYQAVKEAWDKRKETRRTTPRRS
ncbi:MAG: hypothetical protein AABW72_06305 [archaeon]